LQKINSGWREGREGAKNKALKDKDFSKQPNPILSKELARIKQKLGNNI